MILSEKMPSVSVKDVSQQELEERGRLKRKNPQVVGGFRR